MAGIRLDATLRSALSGPNSHRCFFSGAEKGHSAPGGRKKQLPGAEMGHSAPGGRKKRLRGAEKGLSAPGWRKKQLPGAERGPSAPGRQESSRRGRRSALAPLAGGKGGCRGRRRVSAPRATGVFLVSWTRSDFRGCTWYTQCGSEGLLGQGWWTWSGASKWTRSTVWCLRGTPPVIAAAKVRSEATGGV